MIFVFGGKDGNIARKAGLSASSKFVHYTKSLITLLILIIHLYYVFVAMTGTLKFHVACGSDEGWGW
jgi:cytochrome b subunit of formate dehydrogenase